MRVDNIIDTQKILPGDPGVGHALNLPERGKIGAVSRSSEHGEANSAQLSGDVRGALVDAMDIAERHLKGTGLNIRLKVAEKSERLQVEVFDPKTKEVLRRFPPDEIIRLAESIDEMAGLIVNRSL